MKRKAQLQPGDRVRKKPWSPPKRDVEKKFLDVSVSSALATNGSILNSGSICNVVQGAGESNRIGRKVTLKKIMFKYSVACPALSWTSSKTYDVVRVIIYHDKQANGATAAVTDILETDTYHSFNNLANKGRFKILYDKLHTLAPMSVWYDTGGTANKINGYIVEDSFFKNIEIPIEFSGATGAIGEIASNNIGLLVLTLDGTDMQTQMEGQVRLRFEDC